MDKSVALVLSSGGSRGLAQIGVINELERHGFNITSVAGSSIGAVIGGIYAMGKLDIYTEWVCALSKKDIWGLMDFTITNHGLLKGERVFDKMKTFIPDINIEDMPISYTAVASDIISETEVEFIHGSFYDAIKASIAIPAVFTPVLRKDTILVDGGVLNPVPINHVARRNGDMLIVVNLYGKKPLREQELHKNDLVNSNGLFKKITSLISSGDKNNMGYYSLMSRTSSMMVHCIAEMSIEKYKPDLVIDIPYDSASTFEFHKANELIEIGEVATRTALTKSRFLNPN